MAADGGSPRSIASRLFWFAALWLAGVLAVGAISLLIRSALL